MAMYCLKWTVSRREFTEEFVHFVISNRMPVIGCILHRLPMLLITILQSINLTRSWYRFDCTSIIRFFFLLYY